VLVLQCCHLPFLTYVQSNAIFFVLLWFLLVLALFCSTIRCCLFCLASVSLVSSLVTCLSFSQLSRFQHRIAIRLLIHLSCFPHSFPSLLLNMYIIHSLDLFDVDIPYLDLDYLSVSISQCLGFLDVYFQPRFSGLCLQFL
jgi:hypothetical protein